jgi:hypothetical protein
MIEPTTQIAVTMSAQQWQAVLYVMGEAPLPHRVTDPLIREVVAQCHAADLPDNVTQFPEARDA